MNKGDLFLSPQNIQFSKDALVFGVHLGDAAWASCGIYHDGNLIAPPEKKLPDSKGNVHFAMQDIIQAYFEQGTEGFDLAKWTTAGSHPDGLEFEVEIQIEGEPAPAPREKVHILQGGFEVVSNPSYYHFIQGVVLLTNQPTEKYVHHPKQPEFLYLFSAVDQAAKVTYNYTTKVGASDALSTDVTLKAKQTLVLDASREHIENRALKQISRWDITIEVDGLEPTKQRYIATNGANRHQWRSFAFVNSQGKLDFVECKGEQKTVLETSNQQVIFTNPKTGKTERRQLAGGELREIHKANTGYLDSVEQAWFAEMFASNCVFLYDVATSTYREVLLKKGKYTTHDDAPELAAHSFEYEFAKPKELPYSNPKRATTQQAPTTEMLLNIALDTSEALAKAVLSWQFYAFKTSYEVYWSTNPDPATFSLLGTTSNEGSYTHTLPDGDTTYYFQVRVKAFGQALNSTIESVTTPKLLQLSNIILRGDLMFLWEAAREEYKLYRFAWDANLGEGVLDAADNYLTISLEGQNYGMQRGGTNPSFGGGSNTYHAPDSQLTLSYNVRHLASGESSNTETITLTVPPRP